MERLPRPLLQLVRHARPRGRCIPRYVSTVDSGNLAGHLLVVLQACRRSRRAAPRRSRSPRAGITDTLAIAREAIARDRRRHARPARSAARQLEETADEIEAAPGDRPNGAEVAWWSALANRRPTSCVDTAEALGQERGDRAYQRACVDWAAALPRRDRHAPARDLGGDDAGRRA